MSEKKGSGVAGTRDGYAPRERMHHEMLLSQDDTNGTPSGRTSSRIPFVAGVFAITLLGAVVRYRFLDHPFRYDEAYNFLHFSSQSPRHIVTHYMPNNHILHTLMVRVTSFFLGTSPAALRMPALAAGILLIPTTAWLAWTVSRRRGVALLAALAVCGSSQLIEYSANSRGYSWLALLSTLLVICTIRSIAAPGNKWLWAMWGLIAACGAYTVPVMVCPVVGLVLAVLIRVWQSDRHGDDRRMLVRGLVLGTGIAGAATALLYLPIFLSQGAAQFIDTGQWAYKIWGKQFPSAGAIATAVWGVWTRDGHVLWSIVLGAGLVVFAASTLRDRGSRQLVPVMMLLGGVAVVAALQAPLRPRAWMFALPTALVCAMSGVGLLVMPRAATARSRRVLGGVVVAVVAACALSPLRTIVGQRFLTSEPSVLVDIEGIIDECAAFGMDRCALVVRHTPAKRYYLLQKGLETPRQPEDAGVERVYIAADAIQPLETAWHEGVEGFASFGAPRLWRILARSSLYVADRRSTETAAALDQSTTKIAGARGNRHD